MKRDKIHLWLAIILLMLAGCQARQTVANTGFYEPYRILEANMPFADNINDWQFDEVRLVEEDDFGRKYYLYSTYSVMLQRTIHIHIISQRTHDGYVYYYPEDCYWMQQDDGTVLSEHQLQELKARNDWNKAHEDHKMYCVSYEQHPKNIVFDDVLATAVKNHLGLDDQYGVGSNGLEIRRNRQMFLVRVFDRQPEENHSQSEKLYLLVYDLNAQPAITLIEEIAYSQNIGATITEFRGKYFPY